MSVIQLDKIKDLNKEVENYVNKVFNSQKCPLYMGLLYVQQLQSVASKHSVSIGKMHEYLASMFMNSEWIISSNSIIDTLTHHEGFVSVMHKEPVPEKSAYLVGKLNDICLYSSEMFTNKILYGKGYDNKAHNVVWLNLVGG